MLILHVATRTDWEAAQDSGWYRGNTLYNEGFIHCCTPAQLMHVLTRYFPQIVGHVLIEIDTTLLTSELRWEGSPDAFPHLYGPLNTSAVTRLKHFW